MSKSFCFASLAAGLLFVLGVGCDSTKQVENADGQKVVAHAFRPKTREFSEARMNSLKLPPGFAMDVYAKDLKNPRMMAVADDGSAYITSREGGKVYRLAPSSSGQAKVTEAIPDLKDAHGIALRDGKMYIATITEVYVADMNADGSVSKPRVLVKGLPDGGQHPNRTIAFAPDGNLIITVGSTCNACVEPNKEAATILVCKPDGSDRRVFAKGLRNTIGFGWHPATKQMWGMDHGIDWLGNDEPPEELNQLKEGGDYGWPFVYGDRKINHTFDKPEVVPDKQAYAQTTVPATLTYQAHSSPLAMVFYTGAQFPAEYRNDAFVAMRGSWNRRPASGYKVVRIRFDEKGQPRKFEDFLTGFLIEDGNAQFARIAGLAVMKDGSLLVGDDENGVIYRVRYVGQSNK